MTTPHAVKSLPSITTPDFMKASLEEALKKLGTSVTITGKNTRFGRTADLVGQAKTILSCNFYLITAIMIILLTFFNCLPISVEGGL